MEYKLSSFKFSPKISREDKNHVIVRVNSVRTRCPSDANFSGSFEQDGKMIKGEIKVLFSKGTFVVHGHSAVHPGDNHAEKSRGAVEYRRQPAADMRLPPEQK